jgi:hypothetical protein
MPHLSTKRILNSREEVLVTLRKKHGAMLKKIKTERTKLDKFKEDIRAVTSKSSGTIQKKLDEMRAAKKAFKEVLEQCSKSKIFTKQERKEFFWMKDELDAISEELFGDGFNMSEEELAEMMRRQAEERHKQGFNFFEQFTPPVPEAQQRSIREVYKRLAARFHPDKSAGNAALEQRFHTIMQRINTSYQRGDIADLLAIEQEYSEIVDILTQADTPLVDIIEQEIERMRNELELCEHQLDRLKNERKGIERTDDGKMVKDFKKAEKLGLDPIAEMSSDFDISIKEFTRQKEMFERVLAGELSKEQMMEEFTKYSGSDFDDDGAEEAYFASRPKPRNGGPMSMEDIFENMSQEELLEILMSLENPFAQSGGGRKTSSNKTSSKKGGMKSGGAGGKRNGRW